MGTLNRDPECFLHHESRVNSAQCANSLRKENRPKPLKRRLTRITKTRILIIHLTRKPIPVPRGWPVQAHRSRALQAYKMYHSLKFWRNCLGGLNCPGGRCLSASFHQPLVASCFTKQDCTEQAEQPVATNLYWADEESKENVIDGKMGSSEV